MNKPLLVAIGIGAAILLGTPWLFGAFAQQRINAGIERLDAENDVEASIVDYTRGWGTSTATIELMTPQSSIEDMALPPEVATLVAQLAEPIRLVVTMRHGPVLFGGGSSLGLASSTIRLDPDLEGYREFLEETGIDYLFEIRSVTGFNGQSDFVADMPAFELERDAFSLTFSGADLAGVYDASSRRFDAQGSAGSLHVENDDVRFDLESLTFDSDSTWHSRLLRFGYAEANVARISADSPFESFSLEDFGVRFDVTPDANGEHATMSSAYSLRRFSDGDEANLDDVSVVATARRVHLDALTSYYEASQNAMLQDNSAAPLALELEDALYELMLASPEVEFAPVNLRWNGEPLNATMRVSVDAANLPPRSNFTLLALAFQGVLAVDATLAVSEALGNTLAARGMAYQIRRAAAEDGRFMSDEDVERLATAQAAIALAGLVAQGMLTSTNDGYETNAQFTDGRLTVNGNAVPFGLP